MNVYQRGPRIEKYKNNFLQIRQVRRTVEYITAICKVSPDLKNVQAML